MKHSNITFEPINTINSWIESIKFDIGLGQNFTIEPIVGDASLRKYYVLFNKHFIKDCYQQYIIMQTPIDEGMKKFIKIANFLDQLNLPVRVPKIFSTKTINNTGFLLLSYLGENLLFHNLNLLNAEIIYQVAWEALAKIQLTAKQIDLSVMDHRYIKKNLLLFKNWYLQTHLNIPITFTINTLLNKLESYFAKIFREQPQVFVHIDYHSRNLILNTSESYEKIGILDFQDAMLGPITYDIVSLLQDAYLVWPEELTEKILFDYYDYLAQHNEQCKKLSKPQFLKYYYITGLQRHLKNLGIFARLKHFYKKPDYLKHIPTLLNYIYKTCDKFPDQELQILKNFLITHVNNIDNIIVESK